jgi:DNA-binding XRE family transcriptional regulator/predicted RNase H-like HicB family nuclease
MQYYGVVTKEGKNRLVEFPDCPGCQTFAEPKEDIEERAAEALTGWLEANLAAGDAPPEPRKKPRGTAIAVSVPETLAVKLKFRWARHRAELTQAELARRAGVTQPMIAKLEDPDSNPTLETMTKVAAALGKYLDINLERRR